MFKIHIFTQGIICSIEYAAHSKLQTTINNVFHLFVHVLRSVQDVVKVIFSSVRIGYGRVRSCYISNFGNGCFSSIIRRFFLHRIPLPILRNRVHNVLEGSNNT